MELSFQKEDCGLLSCSKHLEKLEKEEQVLKGSIPRCGPKDKQGSQDPSPNDEVIGNLYCPVNQAGYIPLFGGEGFGTLIPVTHANAIQVP